MITSFLCVASQHVPPLEVGPGARKGRNPWTRFQKPTCVSQSLVHTPQSFVGKEGKMRVL
jgi:hypothetical protein